MIFKLLMWQFKILFSFKYFNTLHSYFKPLHDALVSLPMCLWSRDQSWLQSNPVGLVSSFLYLTFLYHLPLLLTLFFRKVSLLVSVTPPLALSFPCCYLHRVTFFPLSFHMAHPHFHPWPFNLYCLAIIHPLSLF